MRNTMLAALATALLCATAWAQEPGEKVRARTAKDAELLMPQKGCGGSDKVALESAESTHKEFKVESEGAEKCTARVAVAASGDKSRKHALVVLFGFSGMADADTMKEVAKISSGGDPLVFCTLVFRAEKKINENTYTYEDLAEAAAVMKAYNWLIAKVEKDHAIDPERKFLVALGGGDEDLLQFAAMHWTEDPDKFAFRAVLMDGLVNGDSLDEIPPVPFVLSADKELMEMNAQLGNTRLTRHFCNDLMARGVPVQYHEYKSNAFGLPPRMAMVMRDAIATMGGPAPASYPLERSLPGVVTDADKVPFKDSPDRYAQQVIELARQEEWKKANDYMLRVIGDKNISSKDKKAIKDFQKEFDKYVKSEMERCNKSIEVSIKAEMWPHWLHRQRLAAMHEAFKDEKWAKGKAYGANLEKLTTYGPAQRDKERRTKLLDAMKLEMQGKRAEAKKIYEDMAKQKNDDGGQSDWPYAAEYRLSWWVE